MNKAIILNESVQKLENYQIKIIFELVESSCKITKYS